MKSHKAYFDNNGTTRMCDASAKSMQAWLQACSNPSSSSGQASKARAMIEKSIAYIKQLCHADKYRVIFTSGASESNCLIIKSIVDAWYQNVKTRPHIIASSIEHKSILECLHHLIILERIELTLVKPTREGAIIPADVKKAIRENTALVTVMGANNEIGSINPIGEIAKICHEHKIPLHSDCVQLFGKYELNMSKYDIDAMSMSFHKIYGPMGLGLLIIKETLVTGWKLTGQISGSQQDGLRGGTENVPAIAASMSALVQNFKNRKDKNEHLLTLKKTLLDGISKQYEIMYISDAKPADATPRILVFGSKNDKYMLPNTVLLSVICEKVICNKKMKELLERKGFIVSIGSACNTASPKASHVLEAIGVDAPMRRGTLRISFGDKNTVAEVRAFVTTFITMIENGHIWKDHP